MKMLTETYIGCSAEIQHDVRSIIMELTLLSFSSIEHLVSFLLTVALNTITNVISTRSIINMTTAVLAYLLIIEFIYRDNSKEMIKEI